GLAGPADRTPRAHRHLASAPVEPQIAIVGAVERVPVVLIVRGGGLRGSGGSGEYKSGQDRCNTNHAFSPCSPIDDGSAAAQWRGFWQARGWRRAAWLALTAIKRRPKSEKVTGRRPQPIKSGIQGGPTDDRIPSPFHRLTASAPILDSPRPSQYGPRGLG